MLVLVCSITTANGLSYVVNIEYKNMTWCTFQVDPILRIVMVRRWLQLRFDFDSTAIRPRYDHSTTYVTTLGLPVVRCCTAA